MEYKFLASVALAILATTLAADKTSNAGGVYLKVLGQSGKIMVGNSEKLDGDDTIVIEMDGLYERTSDGEDTEHKFNTFANQDFTFSDVTESELQGVKCNKFDFSATIADVGTTLKTDIYIFKEDGNLTFGGEDQEVKTGQVKFSVNFDKWTFCNPCKKGNKDLTGAFVDFDISVKGKGSAKKEASDSGSSDKLEKYGLGQGYIKFSKKVEIDSTWQDVQSGYPKYAKKGAKDTFTFRFPKFGAKAFYDPTISATNEENNAGNVAYITMTTLIMAAITALFMM